MTHRFIFEPAVWKGRGEITFSLSEESLPFSMRWHVLPQEEGKYLFHQLVEVDGFTENMHNHFTVCDLSSTTFAIALENHLVGKVEGKGVISEKMLAWEFRENEQGFDGFEIYEKKGESYAMRAEFTAGDGLRTYVSGKIDLACS